MILRMDKMKPKSHKVARLSCCAACGRGNVKQTVTPVTEELIRKFTHPSYNMTVESYPASLRDLCKKHLYLCKSKGAPAREEWAAFRLEDITIPIVISTCSDCTCSMCHTAHFNPIGVTGGKKIVNKLKINVNRGYMECEVQQRVHKVGK